MKWFLGLVLTVALVVGALYGVGRFLLPNDLSVTRTILVDRPRASVYAMIEDLKIVKEWSPYYALDPDAEYAFSGEDSGTGQTMRWSSNVRQVGDGSMSITSAVENSQVESVLDMGDRARFRSLIKLVPGEQGTETAWTISASCAQTWINVPCRYMNLISSRTIGRDLENGLQRLKTLTEQLPDVDFEGLHPDIVQVEAQSYVYSIASTSYADPVEVRRAQALCLDAVQRFMTEFNLAPTGALVRVTTALDPVETRMEFRVGYPFSGPRPVTIATVQVGETPSGRALHVVYEGPPDEVRNTYAAIETYLQAHRIERRDDGLPWEIVHHEGGPDDPEPTRIEIFVPLQ